MTTRRPLVLMLVITMALCFGAGVAYSGLGVADQKMIRIAYANGYKDALEYAFKASDTEMEALKHSRNQFKIHVLYAADNYVNRVASLNQ
ncbi:MAG: hypothetical protein Q9M13_02430 [Mariprofundales bacterium]|nr:hypothetical protein [Mariprofundales bacterium]